MPLIGNQVFAKITLHTEGVASVQKDFIYKFIDKTGMEAFPFKYDIASKFSEDLAAVGKIVLTDNGLGVGLEWGYIK